MIIATRTIEFEWEPADDEKKEIRIKTMVIISILRFWNRLDPAEDHAAVS